MNLKTRLVRVFKLVGSIERHKLLYAASRFEAHSVVRVLPQAKASTARAVPGKISVRKFMQDELSSTP